jgi:hypothetical protein
VVSDLEAKVGGRNFYERVGRHDLAESYEWRSGLKAMGALLGGLAFMGGGAVLAVDGFVYALTSDPCTNCESDGEWLVDWRPPLFVTVAGGVVMIASLNLPKEPLSRNERVELARTFRARQESRPVSLNVTVAPSERGAGGTLVLLGRF